MAELWASVSTGVAMLRDTDFEDDDLKARAGTSARGTRRSSMDLDDVEKAERLLGEAGAVNMAVKEVDGPVVAALDAYAGGAMTGRSA